MLWTLIRAVIGLVGVVVLYLVAASLIRNFATGIPTEEELQPAPLADVDYRFRCSICAAEVVMYAAPDGEIPVPPRHCAERMDIITPVV